MMFLLQRIPFLIELFFNGSFILLYSMKKMNQLPGTWNPDMVTQALNTCVQLIPLVLLFVVIANYINSSNVEDFLRKYTFSIVVFIPLVIAWGDLELNFLLISAHLLSSILALYDDGPTKRDHILLMKESLLRRIGLSPAQLVLISFSTVIILGTFLLMLPFASPEGKSVGFIDNLFMATSATCVTGLTTSSLADNYTLFGQLIILTLIQIGGISIMTLYSSTVILLGRSLAMKDRVVMQDLLNVSGLEELFAMILDIIKYTFFIELWGGIILTIAFTFEGQEFGTAIYYGFFHSISAFCNAGFSLFNNSLESYATNPLIHGTISILVILGGLGFIVLKELKEIIIKRKSLVRMALHTKVVLITSAILTFGGTVFIFFGEFLGGLDHFTLWEKIQVSFFQSVTLRTAGFSTVPLTGLNAYTIYVMALLMFIGGSPGSTAGGIKTTTLAILVESIVSTLKGKKRVGMIDRNIPSPMVVRAIALTFISLMITSLFILLMMKLEPEQSFLTIFFEVISASGTVGLTLGVTPYLSVLGKLALSLLMLIGRIGPLTLLLAIGQQSKKTGKFDYPDGRIMIG